MLKHLKVTELVPGMMVTQVVEQNGPVKIRKVGFIRSNDMIRGLTEMGVSVVEVDLDQSLNIEVEEDTNDATNTNKPAKVTATQRLVASNRQIADVDRQLSQQFHRSLFLPAVDQMPSKWMLYGKPYALVGVFVLFGLFVGIAASYYLTGIINADTAATNTQAASTVNNANSPIKEMASPNTLASSNEGENTQGKGSNGSADTVLSTTDADVDSNSAKVTNEQANNIAGSQATNASTDSSQNAASQTPTSQKKSENAPEIAASPQSNLDNTAPNNTANKLSSNTPRETINGVALEDGQQVLGYQSGVDDDVQASQNDASNSSSTSADNDRREQARPNRSANNNSNNNATGSGTTSEERLNATLLRRIQAAADDVDSQINLPQREVLKVTDLNELPRIDQLSPAILTQMPAMSFSAHMYASNPRDRWVRVNSRRLGEGDTIANDVVLRRIESEKVVLEYKGTQFTMNALSDW